MIICPIKDLGRYAPIIPGLEEALAVVNSLTDYTPRTIPLSGKNRILVQQNTTKPAGNSEAHRKFLDIQCIVKGSEWSMNFAKQHDLDAVFITTDGKVLVTEGFNDAHAFTLMN